MRRILSYLEILVAVVLLSSCTFKKEPLGSEENPVKLFFVPSVEAKTLEDQSRVIKKILEEVTPYKFEIKIPQSYIAVVEAFGADRVDVAALNTFGYILAHEKYGAQALLTVVRHGESTYRSAIFTRADSPIQKLEDLKGKTIAYVDPASASGYLLPLKELKEKNIELPKHVFSMTHDAVISMIYQGRVDAGAAFYSPPVEGKIMDARRLVKTQYPDIESKVKILHLTSEIPNEPVLFRKGLTEEMKSKIVEGLLEVLKRPDGKIALEKMFSVTDFKRSTDKDYDAVRGMLKTLGTSATDVLTQTKKK